MKKVLLASSMILLCTQAYADDRSHNYKGCKALDMNGEWVAYQGTALAGQPHTGVCDFSVLNGVATGSCDFSTGFIGPFPDPKSLNVGVKNVEVKKDCSVELQMDFTPAAPFVSTFHLQLNRDKQSFVGRWDNNFGAVGVSNGVKKFKTHEPMDD